ncbi:hypothetical protein ACFVUY_40110 [Kitasatospora sp. NPDC058063]|uniref:hypothetical protein n=1 Tax=unclassified Kitasatospora TaxID=2633591 RepID=UPI0036DF571D
MDSVELRRRRALRTLVTGAALAAAAVAGAVAVLVWQAEPEPRAGTAASSSAAAAPPSASPSTVVQAVPLPAPARVEKGIPIGYPHTMAGAVSAAAHYTEARDLLSPDTVPDQMMVMARKGEDFFKLTSLAIADARDWRRLLGLPEAGGSTGSDFIAFQVRAYQTESVSADAVDVWLLTTQTPTVGGIQHGTGVFAVAAPVVWDGDDWRLTSKKMRDTPVVAQPGTVQADAAGWRPVAYQH